MRNLIDTTIIVLSGFFIGMLNPFTFPAVEWWIAALLLSLEAAIILDCYGGSIYKVIKEVINGRA